MPLHTFDTSKLPGPVFAEALSPESFAPYGGVMSADQQIQRAQSSAANYGTAVKLHKVAPIVNNYAHSPNTQPATANWNIFRCSAPRKLITNQGTFKIYNSKVLERHPYSTQTFIPMGQHADQVSYIVIVALTDESSPQKLPDPTTVKAFLCRGNQSVTYGAGTWHAPMVVIDESVKHIDFAVLIHENGVADDDCQECYFEPGYQIKYATPSGSKNSSRARL
ncbi:ureidoglycolate hydrolase [Suhomyces tanzawaensis NRRL Y-17324]|uniref:Ureidoglycolate lyase n=1 Tax=Suhomyces tanzawaensis NRRL Y-17324 TaxID=984487 RepID=A0A1E4SFA7_9ASCO|nr:ureidoglycolate hydrolase [Suhomyces tanzawaensis NRRL Y-17324]ODV78156.1 ureidoglycolate hydrolase [Suhomyces tanzawaensis NRRL Y-17324]